MRQKKMPLAIDFLPPRHMILCELFGILRGRLDVVAQLILAPLTDLDDALSAPLVEKPVEVAQIGAVFSLTIRGTKLQTFVVLLPRFETVVT